MLRDVRHEVTDGLLGFNTVKGQGVHVKIGASTVTSDTPILINGNMSAAKIKQRLGLSPLADAVMDSIENGSNCIYCVPVLASVSGTITTQETETTSTSTVTATGNPTNAFKIIAKITGTGALNVATFKVSLDGGYTYSDDITVPVGGKYEVAGTGITLTFAVPEGSDGFVVDNVFAFTTTAPTMTNEDVLTAIETLKNFAEVYEFVHVVGESAVALWQAVSVAQKELLRVHHKPLLFLLEAYVTLFW